MRKLWSGIVLFLLAADLRYCHGSAGQKLVCYTELWASTRPSFARYDISTLPPGTCDYLILAYLTLDFETWALRMHTGFNVVAPDDLHKAVKLRSSSPNMKVLLSVGGFVDGVDKYSDMLSERRRRKLFIRSVIQTLEAYDLDGLELSWRYPGTLKRGGRAGDKENFLDLVKELKTAFKYRNWVLTASVPPDEASIREGYNVSRLNSLLHQMHVRTMDLRGVWTGAASGHSPLYSSSWEDPKLQALNVNGSVSLWIKEGASPRKLFPTLPLHGRSFTLASTSKTEPGSPIEGMGRATPFLNSAGNLAYFEICDAVQNKRFTRFFQNGSETPYAVGDRQWVGYEDEESLLKKVKYVALHRLGGAAVFAVTVDDFNGICGQSYFLVKKMKDYLTETSSPALDPRDGLPNSNKQQMSRQDNDFCKNYKNKHRGSQVLKKDDIRSL